MKIAFKAQIKLIKAITLVSGDKQASITLQLNDDNTDVKIMNALNELWDKSPDLMNVVIMDDSEIEK